jgi:hypothetical protein
VFRCGSGNYFHKAPAGQIANGNTCAIWSSTLGCKVGGAPLSGAHTPSGVASVTGETVTQNSRVDAARVLISSTDLSYWGPKNRNVYLFSNVTYFTVSSKWWSPAA